MFKLLSKESTIFSIPFYIGFLLLMLIGFNILDFNYLNLTSSIIALCGASLGYYVFFQMNLTYSTHLPLFLYTFFIFAFYSPGLDIGISAALFTNSFLLLMLTNPDDNISRKNYVLAGVVQCLGYLFLPAAWPMLLFLVIHIVATSRRIGLNLLRLFFGIALTLGSYFCIAYFFGLNEINYDYFPIPEQNFISDFRPIACLAPLLLMGIYALLDHFRHYNEKSPSSRYKYTFLLTFTGAQLVSIFLYMGYHFELLLLLALPFSIILSRMLWFLPKYWMKEACLWLIVLSLVIFRAETYKLIKII